MACFRNSGRFCARAQDKLCQLLTTNSNNCNFNSNIKTNQLYSNYQLNCGAGGNNNVCVRKLTTIVLSVSSTSTSSSNASKRQISSSSAGISYRSNENNHYNHDNINNKKTISNSDKNLLFYKNKNAVAANKGIAFIINSPVIRNYSTKSKSLITSFNHNNQHNISSTRSSQQKRQQLKQQHQQPYSSIREYSSVHSTQQPGPAREIQVDPYLLLEDDLKYFYDDIIKILDNSTSRNELKTIATYYFDGQGKALRPMVTLLMARAVNYHMNKESRTLLSRQREIAIFSEMVHSASLVHDDVIDQSDFRRGKPSVNAIWNHKKVTMAGDFILSIASVIIARLRDDEVTIILSQILTDLIQGEFMQLGAKETENERFAHYLTKTYRKTASLIANTLKSVAVIAGADESLSELAFQYGRNIGLAFQLVDDLLDFVSSTEAMGKPTATDLKLGLATAPVLFACEKYPELNPMIMRRFQEPGDVERAFELVHKSQGLEQTRFLARKHCIEAIRLAQEMTESPYQKGLIVVSDLVINRMK